MILPVRIQERAKSDGPHLPSTVTFLGRAAEQAPFPGTPFHAYSRCLPDYLRGLAKKAVEKRDAELAKLVTPAAIELRQMWARETLWKLIGGMCCK